MGGKSSSSSNSTTNTEQYDQRVAAGDDSIVIGAEAVLELDATDPRAFDLTQDLVQALEVVGGDLVNQSYDFADQALASSEHNLMKMQEFMERRATTEETTLAEQALKFAVPVAIVAVAATAIGRLK